MLGLTFSSKLDWGSYIISTGKTAPNKIGVLIRSMKFLSPEVALHLYHLPMYGIQLSHLSWCPYLLLGIAGLLVLHLLHLLNPWPNIEMWPAQVFSIGISLVDVLQNWLNKFHLFLEGGLLIIRIDCMIFLSPFLDVARMSMSTVSFFT